MPANTEDTGSIPALAGFHMPQGNWARAPQQEKPLQWEVCAWQSSTVQYSCSLQLEKAQVQQHSPSTAKYK